MVVNFRQRNLASFNCFFQLWTKEVGHRLFLVKTCCGCLFRTVCSTPVGNDKSLEAPFILEHIAQRVGVLTTEVAIDPVVGTHHCTGIRDGNGDMKCEQIRFLHRPLRDDGVHKETPRLLIIHHIVLDVADHMLRLFTLHKVADDGAREEWIFTRILEAASIPWLAD